MDATDHENIPSTNHYCGLSGWIHVGFDYLGNDSKILSASSINIFKNESEKKHHTGAKSLKGMENKPSTHKKNCGSLNDDFSGHSTSNATVDSTNSSPAVTPQASPSMRRKMYSGLTAPSSQPAAAYSSLTWVCRSFFNNESDEYHPNSSSTGMSEEETKKKAARKVQRKYIITNFDINALSPTSW